MRSAVAEDTMPEIASPPETARPRARSAPAGIPGLGTRGPGRSVPPVSSAPRDTRPQPPSGPAPRRALEPARTVVAPTARALAPARSVVAPTPVPPARARPLVSVTPVARSAPPPARPPAPAAELPSDVGSEVRRKSYAAAPKPVRPMAWNGAPPTVIRDLDALFANDRAKREMPTSRPPARPVSGAAPVDPARFARMLLEKVEADFTPAPSRAPREALIAAAPPGHAPPLVATPRPPVAPMPAAPAPAPSPLAAPPTPRVVAFVPSPPTLHYQETVQLALPDDDEDLAALVPWYRRMWSRLFGGR